MKNTFKKALSVILAALMLFSMGIVAFAAKTENEHPTVYITGAQTNKLFGADGEQIYPIGADPGAIIKESIEPCVKKLIEGFITDDYEPYVEEFRAAFSPVFEKVKLDKNGEVSDSSHPEQTIYNVNIPHKSAYYGVWDYRFWYDWRISPMVAADELKIYIDMVKAATNEEKVNLMGRCYGANVIAAYLVKYTDHAVENVADVSYLASSIDGIDMLDAIFTGEMKFEDTAINNFLDYFMDKENIVEDETTAALIKTLVDLFDQIYILGYTGELAQALVDEIKYDLIPALLKDSFGTMPSYWAMVSPDKYEAAIEFVFGDCKEEYAKLIEKTDEYHNRVQKNYNETEVYLESKGINFYVFAKYGFPEYPISKGAAHQSDGNTSVYKQSFGATAADFGKVLSEEYIASLETDKYVSPDRAIDASTCRYPERTWFVRDLHHDSFPNNFTAVAMNVMKYDYTVSDGVYAQYLQWKEGNIAGEVEPLKEAPKEDSKLGSFFRFLKALFDFLTKLIKGEIVLSA